MHLTEKEESVLHLWSQGEKEKAIENNRKFNRGAVFVAAFRRSMFDFIDAMPPTAIYSWRIALQQAGQENDQELITAMLAHVASAFPPAEHPHFNPSLFVFMGRCSGGGHFKGLSMRAADYKTQVDYGILVGGIVKHGRNDLWDKLSMDDVKQIRTYFELYRCAIYYGNDYVSNILEQYPMTASELGAKMEAHIFRREYEKFAQLFKETNLKVDDQLNLVNTALEEKSGEKILDMILARYGKSTYRRLKKNWERKIPPSHRGDKREIFFCYMGKVFQHDCGDSNELAELLRTCSTEQLKYWIFPGAGIHYIWLLIQYGAKDMRHIRKKIPELFTHEHLLELFFRIHYQIPTSKTNQLPRTDLVELGCATVEEMAMVSTACAEVNCFLLNFFPPVLAPLILSYV